MSGCGCKKPQEPPKPVQTTNESVVNAVKKTVEKYYQRNTKK